MGKVNGKVNGKSEWEDSKTGDNERKGRTKQSSNNR